MSRTVLPRQWRATGGHRRRAVALAVSCLAALATAAATTGPAEAASVRASTTPSAPQSPTAVADGAHRMLVTWDVPADTGDSQIDGYVIDVYDATGAQWLVTSTTAPGTATSDVLSGLEPGVGYTVTVAAHNDAGVGPASTPSPAATVQGPPDGPLNVTLTATPGDRLKAIWRTPPGNGAAVTRTIVDLYDAQGRRVSATTVPAWRTSLSLPIGIGTRLPAGHSYYVQLRAANRYGVGTPTAESDLATVSATGSPAPTDVTAPPPYTVSDYISPADDQPATLTTLGCDEATADAPEQARGRLVLIDFGGQYGTGSVLLIGSPSTELTYAQVVSDAEAYATGYESCVAAGAGPVTIGITTNNSLNVSQELGTEWATDVVNPAEDWARATYHGQVVMAASDDMEPGFGPVAPSRAWVAGYVAASDGNMYYDSGSADGCFGTTASALCNDGWTVGDLYYTNGGADPRLVESLPEIYVQDGIQAEQWQGISNSGPASGQAPLRFAGALTMYTTCLIPGVTCTGIDNTPTDGWNQLYADLNSSAATAQPSLPWSTDITYSYFSLSSGLATRATPAATALSRTESLPSTNEGAVPWCTAGRLTASFDGHGQDGAKPVTHYPFVLANTGTTTCQIAAPTRVSAVTHQGASLDLAAGNGTGQSVTVLAPGAWTAFSLGLSDTGTSCQYLRQFSIDLPHLSQPLTAPITGLTGGAAVCGTQAGSLTGLGAR